MAQFDVYILPDGAHVVDVQSPLASVHRTRLVIPLIDPSDDTNVVGRLNPKVTLDGEPWLLATHFAVTLDAKLLRGRIGSLADQEWTIKAALDFLINGF
ncbi:CcdB family protein [uncultured Sphingomonas sp.]|uniref:CcdB family protein n=1 Tax=unclassified Sphingomonas TaxID=196159 RepID=UPI0025F5B213|nr:CcdB family protein [uncultured Sphingomonas sp.]